MANPDKNEKLSLMEIAQVVAEALGDQTNQERARLELVERLLSEDYPRGAIIRLVNRTFKCSYTTIDRDIRKARDNFLDYASQRSFKERLADHLARARVLINKAQRRGDLTTALAGQKHLAELEGVLQRQGVNLNFNGFMPEGIGPSASQVIDLGDAELLKIAAGVKETVDAPTHTIGSSKRTVKKARSKA